MVRENLLHSRNNHLHRRRDRPIHPLPRNRIDPGDRLQRCSVIHLPDLARGEATAYKHRLGDLRRGGVAIRTQSGSRDGFLARKQRNELGETYGGVVDDVNDCSMSVLINTALFIPLGRHTIVLG